MATSDFDLPTPKPSVVFQQLGDEAVLLSTTEEVYFGVNKVGARIWALLPPATRTFDEMCATLAQEYSDVDQGRIRHDAQQFIEDIVASGLATPAPSVEPRGPAGSPTKATETP